MHIRKERGGSRRRGWWPWLLAALLVAADLLLAHLHRGRLAGWVETGLALDMMLVLPLLLAWSTVPASS